MNIYYMKSAAQGSKCTCRIKGNQNPLFLYATFSLPGETKGNMWKDMDTFIHSFDKCSLSGYFRPGFETQALSPGAGSW